MEACGSEGLSAHAVVVRAPALATDLFRRWVGARGTGWLYTLELCVAACGGVVGVCFLFVLGAFFVNVHYIIFVGM